MRQKILVTGGAGYIGAHTASVLDKEGYEPVLLDNFSNSDRTLLSGLRKITGKQITFHEGDCNDRSLLHSIFQKEGDIAAVIHFAARRYVGESVEKPLYYYRNNVGSTITLLEVMLEHGVSDFVFSSSCTVYGQPDELPVTEDTPRKPAESPYGNTKKICEDIIQDTVLSGQPIKAAILRYFNPIGTHPSHLMGEVPHGVPNNLIPFLTQAAVGVRPELVVFGDDYDTPDGSCIRDYIDIMDLAEAHVQALKFLRSTEANSLFEIFNLGIGEGKSVLELIKTFEKATGVSLNYKIGPRRPGDVEKVYANVDKASEVLLWKATRDMSESLYNAWQWQLRLGKH
ncbi:UDP-glucose 4-epimerase GalE [Roseivirga sp. BDSF3-8]|uniref:UDP-glucose 4-epimerase GalE n=1 Tax=Roseivirga sp. BDSF3-8 TaxID=3241598 RepID=UPI003531CE74